MALPWAEEGDRKGLVLCHVNQLLLVSCLHNSYPLGLHLVDVTETNISIYLRRDFHGWEPKTILVYRYCCSVAKLCLTLHPCGLQHTRLLYPLLTPEVCSNSCP